MADMVREILERNWSPLVIEQIARRDRGAQRGFTQHPEGIYIGFLEPSLAKMPNLTANRGATHELPRPFAGGLRSITGQARRFGARQAPCNVFAELELLRSKCHFQYPIAQIAK